MANVLGAVHGSLVFDRRTRVLAEHLSEMIPPRATVLDVGCGDGTIDSLILSRRPDIQIQGVDVFVRPSTRIKVEVFDGETLPLADKSFDTVVFVDVLHHTQDPLILLREANRVARKSILIKDHTMDGLFAYSTLRFMDWVGNAPHGVVLPYNYWSEQRWQSAFSQLGLKIDRKLTKLGLYPFPASMVFERRLHFIASILPKQ
jgi:SAM-dependent methyltransferase